MTERLKSQLEFILEIDKEKNILRQTHLSGNGRRENDAEHAWHMAIMVYLLKEYSNCDFDTAKAMMMALIHDLVEIDAGDTYAYDTEMLKSREERERKAADRIFGMLPEDQNSELRSLFEEFETGESAEAKFAKAMDNLQPLLLNNSNNGGDWRAHNVRKSQVINRQSGTKAGSETLWNISEKIVLDNVKKGNIVNDD